MTRFQPHGAFYMPLSSRSRSRQLVPRTTLPLAKLDLGRRIERLASTQKPRPDLFAPASGVGDTAYPASVIGTLSNPNAEFENPAFEA